MKKDKILITGGTGRLAKELKKHLDGTYVGIEDFDFTKSENIYKGDYELILHMGAYTDVARAEKEPFKCIQVNVLGTLNLLNTYQQTPFIFISSEWAHNPLGVYALSKKIGEEIVKTHPMHLILRTSFKPNPWPFEFAYKDQWTQGDYVDIIAKKLAETVQQWDKTSKDIQYLGTGRKTMFDLAIKTKSDVIPNSVDDYNKIVGNIVPKDYV